MDVFEPRVRNVTDAADTYAPTVWIHPLTKIHTTNWPPRIAWKSAAGHAIGGAI